MDTALPEVIRITVMKSLFVVNIGEL